MDKNTRDIKSINARLNKLQNQLTDNILQVSFGQTDTELTVGAIIYNISLSANLEGKIPKGERFMLSFPDGSNPLIIQNQKEDLTTTVDTIPIYVDGTETWEQLIYPSVTYPIGSLISSVNYAANDTNFASGSNQEVQFNSQGELAGDSNFTFDSSTDTLSATNISGDLTGDVTGDVTGNVTGNTTGNHIGDVYATDGATKILESGSNLATSFIKCDSQNASGDVVLDVSTGELTGSLTGDVTGDVTGDLTGNVTATSVLADGVTATTQADATSDLTVATTEFVMNNAVQPGGSGSGNAKQIQFNNNGDFDASSNLTFDTTTSTLSTTNLYATGITGTLGTGTTVATSPPANDDSKKIATTEWVLDNAGGGGNSSGSSGTIQLSDGSGGFTSNSNFTITSLGKLNATVIDASQYVKTRVMGDNIGTGIYAYDAIGRYWYLKPSDFIYSSGGDTGELATVGNYMQMPNSSQYYMAQIQVPVNYKVTKIFIKGNANIPFSVDVSGWSTAMGASKGGGTVNTELTLTNQLTESEGNYYTISINPSASNQRIYGARLTLEETTE